MTLSLEQADRAFQDNIVQFPRVHRNDECQQLRQKMESHCSIRGLTEKETDECVTVALNQYWTHARSVGDCIKAGIKRADEFMAARWDNGPSVA